MMGEIAQNENDAEEAEADDKELALEEQIAQNALIQIRTKRLARKKRKIAEMEEALAAEGEECSAQITISKKHV